ncbi:MAG: hypothetical protein Q9183_004844 [Haloplaca sp. 2 TL-2023]
MAQMAAPDEAADYELEPQHQRLQANVEKLKESINYWQTWEADYEGLKEELQKLSEDVSASTLRKTSEGCTGELLNQKEVNLLLSHDKSGPRTSQQVIGLLSRRIDYVQSNVTTLQNSLQVAEDKFAASEALDPTQHSNEDGSPFMEIQEQLDEAGNVISSTLTPASEAAPRVVEALRKAGINGIPTPASGRQHHLTSGADSSSTEIAKEASLDQPRMEHLDHDIPRSPRDSLASPSTSESDGKGDGGKGVRRRKSVTFADGTKQAPPIEHRPARDVQAVKARNTARRIKAEVRGSIDALKKLHHAGYIDEQTFDRFRTEYIERLHPVDSSNSKRTTTKRQAPTSKQQTPTVQNPGKGSFKPTIPNSEPAEDVKLRQEMIKYNMDEVGAVVAEMNLDDDESDQSSAGESTEVSAGESTEESEYRNSSDDDEDQWGMSRKRAIGEDYVKEMQALERKMNSGSVQNVGPHASVQHLLQAEKELEVGQDGNPVRARAEPASVQPGKKAVRFAESLDIQEHPPSPIGGAQHQPTKARSSMPVSATVTERKTSATNADSIAAPIPAPRRKVSQFKSSKLAAAADNTPHLTFKESNGGQVKTASLSALTPPARPKMNPTGPLGRTHASVIERPYVEQVKKDSVPAPDGFDESLLQQELKVDYHRSRNRMIQKQGGFLGPEEKENEEGPLTDENGKKISKFKAARLRAMDR